MSHDVVDYRVCRSTYLVVMARTAGHVSLPGPPSIVSGRNGRVDAVADELNVIVDQCDPNAVIVGGAADVRRLTEYHHVGQRGRCHPRSIGNDDPISFERWGNLP